VTRGRPRSFDRDAALEQALALFWKHGYEPASIAALTNAMGIRPASLYAAFGDKRRLFSEAVDRYQATHGAFTTAALTEEPTARGAIERMLHEIAVNYTDPGHPPGCLVISGAVNHGPEAAEVEDELREIRSRARAAIAERLREGVADGELPEGTDTDALAEFIAVVVRGMSRSAQDGASAEELHAVADLAMSAWPRALPGQRSGGEFSDVVGEALRIAQMREVAARSVGRASGLGDALAEPRLVAGVRGLGEDREVAAADAPRSGGDLPELAFGVGVVMRFVKALFDADHGVGEVAGREERGDQRAVALARDDRCPGPHRRDVCGERFGLVADRAALREVEDRDGVLVGEAGGDRPPDRAVGAVLVEEEDGAAVGAPAVGVVLAVGVSEEVFETQRRHGGGSCRVVGEKVVGSSAGQGGLWGATDVARRVYEAM
jgi:AcrR family transcriptional regulator